MVFWHERTWPLLIRMMAQVIGCFGVRTIWGSSNRQPRAGLGSAGRMTNLSR